MAIFDSDIYTFVVILLFYFYLTLLSAQFGLDRSIAYLRVMLI